MRLPGVSAELASAVRKVNAAYSRLPEDSRPDINSEAWLTLERQIDAHCRRGDRDLALAAVEAWEGAALRQLAEAES